MRCRNRDSGEEKNHALNHLFLFIGADPNTHWLAGSGIALDPHGFIKAGGPGRHVLATSRDGIFAIGDVRSGSIKRVAAAVGEGAQVVAAVHGFLAQERGAESGGMTWRKLAPPGHDPRRHAQRAGLRGVPQARRRMVSPAHLPHLRHVGCCDQSKNKHATKHYHRSKHPIIEGYDPPEGWGWCYVDEVMFDLSDRMTPHNGPIPRYY